MRDPFIFIINRLNGLTGRKNVSIGWVALILLTFFLSFGSALKSKASNHSLQAKIDPQSRKKIEKLLPKLDAASRAIRHQTEEELLKLPPQATSFLRQKLSQNELPASVSNSLSFILEKMENREIEHLKQPAKVHLSGRMFPQVILSELKKQTGNQVALIDLKEDSRGEPNLNQKIPPGTIVLPDKPLTFWKVLNQIEKQSDFHLKQIKDSSELVLVHPNQQDNTKPILTEDGLFRIAINSCKMGKLPGNDNQTRLRISLELTSVPRIYPLILFFQTQKLELVSDDGTRLSPFSPESQIEISATSGRKTLTFHVDYLVPKSVQENLKSLKLTGNVQTVVSTWQEDFEFDFSQNLSEQTRHQLTLKMKGTETERLKNGEEAFRVNLLADYDLDREKYAMLFESHRRAIFKNEPWLLDLKTDKIIKPLNSHSHMEQDSNLMQYTLEFRNLEQDKSRYRLIFPAYTIFEFIPVQINFPEIIPKRVP